jgi:K+-transporting ATPase ATPase C chain
MGKTLLVALRVTLITLVLTGLAYPLLVTGIAQVLFSSKANGSLVRDDKGNVVGSELLGQGFSRPEYFQPRPSAAGSGWDATSSSGSNWGTTSARLQKRAQDDFARLTQENPDAKGPVPVELLSASGSGLDPHISKESALWQAPRVAKSRNVAVERVSSAIETFVEGRDFGFMGEPRVNVLVLNLAIDNQFGRPPPLPPPPADAGTGASDAGAPDSDAGSVDAGS